MFACILEEQGTALSLNHTIFACLSALSPFDLIPFTFCTSMRTVVCCEVSDFECGWVLATTFSRLRTCFCGHFDWLSHIESLIESGAHSGLKRSTLRNDLHVLISSSIKNSKRAPSDDVLLCRILCVGLQAACFSNLEKSTHAAWTHTHAHAGM